LGDLDDLRRLSPVLLAVESPALRFMNEDGSPMVFAHDQDALLEIAEWCTMKRIRLTQDPVQPHEAVLVAMTEGWRTSPSVTRAIARAQRSKLPLFFLDPRSWRITQG
jgi:hypothetical protein